MENQGTSNASLSSTSEASPPENVSELCKKLHVATANLVRQSNKLPMLGDGHELYSSFADYAEFMRVQRNRAIIMLRRLTNYQGRLNESALNDGMGPLIGFCDALVDRAAIALDEHQRSLTRDRIKARQISLGAEPILRSATSTIVASASNSQIVKPGSAADAFSRNAHRGGTFRDGGGRFAVFSTHSEMMTENTAKKGVGNATINATAANVGPAQTILKPQRAFRELINNSDLPFVPKLRFKHNAINGTAKAVGSGSSVGKGKMRLMLAGGDEAMEENGGREENMGKGMAREWPSDAQADEGGRMSLGNGATAEDEAVEEHPYAEELAQFEPTEHSQMMALPETVKEPTPLESSPPIWVRQLTDLEALIATLNEVHEFAFDVEHHSFRSFLGLSCLLQISTRSADYLVDPFPLWPHLHLLNEPFTNPNIVKVAFSADSDVLWLQRDFGIYVVGLFDCRLGSAWLRSNTTDRNNGMDSGGGSLAQMLADLLDIHLDKQFQMADWRQRPLIEPMVNYARADTHFLLDCYDRLKLGLAKHRSHNDTARSALCEVFMQSVQICQLVFKQPRFNPMGHMKLLRSGRRFNNRQLEALARLWAWRDRTAREQDESLHYVLPEHMMLQIAETLPREPSGILACCAPVPPIVRSEQAALHKIICHARDLPLEHSVVSSVQSATPARERNADEVLGEFDANRITAQRAKLELRIDLSRAYKSLLTMTTTDETAMLHNDNKNRQRGDGGAEGTAPRGTMRKLIEIANRWEHLKETNNKRTDEEEGRTGKESVSNNELKKLLTMNRRMSAIRTVVLIDDEEEDNDGEQRGNGEEYRDETERRKNQIRNRIEHDWVSPYDNYVLTARQKTLELGSTNVRGTDVNGNIVNGGIIRATTIVEKQSKKRTTNEWRTNDGNTVEETVEEEEETQKTKRKRYSHLDEREEEAEEEKLTVKTEEGMADEAEEDEIIVMDAEERTFFADPANLTRKARKRQRKKVNERKEADIY
ncbi:hypothetical protein niasHT_037985 [Heterodera trifolii]|uniref:HRDC domain-containing protein n=1 Tax=Heterodera trifolii TaxID=157864 RepID=A0ABD2HTP4_9BILA